MERLKEIDDPRQPGNGMPHDFQEILVTVIAAVLCGCDTQEALLVNQKYQR